MPSLGQSGPRSHSPGAADARRPRGEDTPFLRRFADLGRRLWQIGTSNATNKLSEIVLVFEKIYGLDFQGAQGG